MQCRDGKIHPDTALDHQDQQQRHTEGLKSKEQDQHHEAQTHQAYHPVICGKGVLEVFGADRVARQAHVLGIIL